MQKFEYLIIHVIIKHLDIEFVAEQHDLFTSVQKRTNIILILHYVFISKPG